MKKTFLITLIAVMIATPCFAQEVEAEGSFTIEGTLWDAQRNEQYFGFYEGKIYMVWYFEDSPNVICQLLKKPKESDEPTSFFSFCFDFLSFSIAYYHYLSLFHYCFDFMLLKPQESIGWEKGCCIPPEHNLYVCRHYDLIMTSDNWSTAECAEIR